MILQHTCQSTISGAGGISQSVYSTVIFSSRGPPSDATPTSGLALLLSPSTWRSVVNPAVATTHPASSLL